MIRSQEALTGGSAKRSVGRAARAFAPPRLRQPVRPSPSNAAPPDLRAVRLSMIAASSESRRVAGVETRMQPGPRRGHLPRQRLDCLTIERVEVHVLAPAAQFEHQDARPSFGRAGGGRFEVEHHRFARTEDCYCMI